ncbi:SCY1-like protein 2 [Trypanosoma conorhini]|uniref:SCY1-like protein 2 n=1 Tax=Trypanosoma conorhini TaxID=83891 RepID=A0A3R7LA50_9TRYP|nr:SCY1-like protein 2 [Trypanosoma conorhini]RNF23016.1 SCY1-like protein 2 [Trypanosoma conorhini]
MLSMVKGSLTNILAQDPIGDYELCTRNFRAGKNDLIHVQDGVEISSGRLISVLSLEVNDVVRRCATASEAHCVIDAFKHGMDLLTRLRHPGILRVVKPLVDDKKHLRIVTERISFLLPTELSNGSLSQQEVLFGLLGCAGAIQFIHERGGHLLCDFCPQAVCIVEGEWKLFDFSHAVPANNATSLASSHPRSGIAAPLLDYCSPELVEAFKEKASEDLSVSSPREEKRLKLPDSDIFSFVVVCVEALSGRKAFNSGGRPELYSNQYAGVEKEVAKWFSGQPLSVPRPSFATLRKEQIFATEPLLLLETLGKYDTLDDAAQFAALKGVYKCLGRSMFEEALIVRVIIPLMRREGLQENRLRYALPILLQCCRCVSAQVFVTHLRDFFTALLSGVSAAESFERCGDFAEVILEKMDPLLQYFSEDCDRNEIILPFLERCVEAKLEHEKVTKLAVDRIAQLAEAGGGLKFSDCLPDHLVDLLLSDPHRATSVFVCLERVVRYASVATRQLVEARLIHYAGACASEPGRTTDTLSRALSLVERLHEGFSREHKATRSIPLMAPLLLSPSSEVSSFSRRMIETLVVEVTVLSRPDAVHECRPAATHQPPSVSSTRSHHVSFLDAAGGPPTVS